MTDLSGKRALVTGGARGIGRAIAIELAKCGADVHILNRSQSSSDSAKEAFKEAGVSISCHLADVSNTDEVEKVISELDTIHILVNNAGITRDDLLIRMKEEAWDTVVDTNLKGAFNCIKAVTRKMMKARWGRIINISSVIGQTGNPGQSNYAAAKSGLFGLTKSAARELASRNITVNAIAPGYIDTDMTSELGDDVKDKIKEQIPLKRIGKPEDIAHCVSFLCAESGDYITGQILNVDGGMVM